MPRRPAKKLATAPPPSAAAVESSPVPSTTASDDSPAAVPGMEAAQEPKKAADPTTALSEGEAVADMENVAPEVELDGEGTTAGNTEEGDSEEEPEEDVDAGPEGVNDIEEDEDVEEDFEEFEGQKDEIMAAVTGGSGHGNVAVEGDDVENNGLTVNEVNEENASALHMDNPLTERKDQMELEIHVGGLHREIVEEELMGVFGVFGEIESVRIMRSPYSMKCKGYAFIRYRTVESVKKAVEEFKDGTKIRGKTIKISACRDNVILRVVNICETWTKKNVTEGLKHLGVDKVVDIGLAYDPEKKGNNTGVCFLEFYSHSDALSACLRLGKEDAMLGSDKSAKVSFARRPLCLKVKTVYLDGIPPSWHEEKIKEICKPYGEIESVRLLKFLRKKGWQVGFVAFTSRECAFSCIEGINSSELNEGEHKVRAFIARPETKNNTETHNAKGDVIVQKKGNDLKDVTSSKSKETNLSGKRKPDNREIKEKVKNAKKNVTSNVHNKQIEGKAGVRQVEKVPAKKKKRHERENVSVVNQGKSKKARTARFNGRGVPSTVYGNPRNLSIVGGHNYMVPAINSSSYFQPAGSYNPHGYVGASRSIAQRADLEPHAGYIPPVEQSLDPFRNDRRRIQERMVAPSYGVPSVPQTLYHGSSSHTGYEVGYGYPSSGPYAPHRAYY